MLHSEFVQFKTLAIIGLGLIGGSIAKDIKRLGISNKILGYDKNPKYEKQILSQNFVDYLGNFPDEKIIDAELIILAVPVNSFEDVILELIPYISKSAIITDVGSVKLPLIKLMNNPRYKNIRFVGGHPIAGSEYFGPSAAQEKMFTQKRLILTPIQDSDQEAIKIVSKFWQSLGALVSEMEPQSHDKLFASVSHLPHLLAYASIQAICNSESTNDVLKHSGAGLKDFSRIASSSPEMWSDIFIANQKNLIPKIDIFKEVLNELEDCILKKDKKRLIQMLKESKTERDRWMT